MEARLGADDSREGAGGRGRGGGENGGRERKESGVTIITPSLSSTKQSYTI